MKSEEAKLPQPNQVNADRRDHLAELDDLQELERVLIQADALDRELGPELCEAPTGTARALADQQASDERYLLHKPLLVSTRVRLLEDYEDDGARKGDTGCIIEVFEGSRRAKVEWDDNGGGWNILPTHDLIEIRRTPAVAGEST